MKHFPSSWHIEFANLLPDEGAAGLLEAVSCAEKNHAYVHNYGVGCLVRYRQAAANHDHKLPRVAFDYLVDDRPETNFELLHKLSFSERFESRPQLRLAEITERPRVEQVA